MKCVLLAAFASSGLIGCATSLPPAGATSTEVDQARVSSIERAAARAGVRVIWVRMPTKTVPGSGG
jgi:hypothetical protein